MDRTAFRNHAQSVGLALLAIQLATQGELHVAWAGASSVRGPERTGPGSQVRSDDNKGDPFAPSPERHDPVDLVNDPLLDDLEKVPPGMIGRRLRNTPSYFEWSADRKLSEKQASRVNKLTKLLADGRASSRDRSGAINELRDWGVATAIPVLESRANNDRVNWLERSKCVQALGMIRDVRAVEALIELVKDPVVGLDANGVLRRFTGANWGGEFTPDKAEQQRDPMPSRWEREKYQAWLRRRQAKWRAWWKDNKEKVQLDREWIVTPETPVPGSNKRPSPAALPEEKPPR